MLASLSDELQQSPTGTLLSNTVQQLINLAFIRACFACWLRLLNDLLLMFAYSLLFCQERKYDIFMMNYPNHFIRPI